VEQVSPTRSELLGRKAQIQLARQGAELLRGKREALVREFLSELQRFVDAREALQRELSDAKQALMRSLTIDGPELVASAALASRRPVRLETTERNIWGTKIVEARTDYLRRQPEDRGFSAVGASARIEDTADRFEATLDLILRIGGGDPADLPPRERPRAAPAADARGAG
jgi:V/A-type H+-transporting ATPase subunit D